MANGRNEDLSEIEIVCPCCDYSMRRPADRLRRDGEILCPNCGAVFVPADAESGPTTE